MNLTLIGSGNVAWVLGHKFRSAGHRIMQVISPQEDHARQLAEEFSVPWSNDLEAIDLDTDIVIIAVKDTAIRLLNDHLRLGSPMVVHTAGAIPLDAIKDVSPDIGVFYPLQTLRKNFNPSADVPLLLEANNQATEKKLMELASSISGKVVWMSSEERLKMHVAGVFCNNFTNRLIALCENFCQNESLDFSLLLPIIQETFDRISTAKALDCQTGPAKRGDLSTMKMHELVLEKYPEMLQLYEIFSEGIGKYYADIDNK